MIASVATAVITEITGAMAIIHGTAVAGVNCSLESSLSTSASGCIRPYGPTRLGPMRDWKRPSSLRSTSRISGHDLQEDDAKITIALTIRTSVPSSDQAAPRPAPRPPPARSVGQAVRRCQEDAAGRHAGRTATAAATLSPSARSRTSSPLLHAQPRGVVGRQLGARARRQEAQRGRVLGRRPAQSDGAAPRRSPSGSSGGSASGSVGRLGRRRAPTPRRAPASARPRPPISSRSRPA